MNDAMRKLIFADDLDLVANGNQELQDTLEEGNGLFTRHGLKRKLEKTEVLHTQVYATRGLSWTSRWREETGSGGQFRVPRRGSVRRREDEERERRHVEECRPERTRG